MFAYIRKLLWHMKSEKSKHADKQAGFDSVFEDPTAPSKKDKPNNTGWLITLLIVVFGGLIVAYLSHRFGWTK